MVTKDQIYRKIEKEVETLNDKVNHFKLYNVKAFAKRSFVRSGLVLRKLAPYLLASFIVINLPFFKTNRPFIREIRTTGAKVGSMVTSTGVEEIYTSFDNSYNFQEIHYSTPWVKDENGLYSREVKIFQFNKEFFSKYGNEGIFKMSVEEISKLLTLDNIKTIKKSKLENEDFVYKEPAIVVFNNYISSEITTEEQESIFANIMNILFYFLLCGVFGYGIEFTTNIIFKHRTENKLKELIGKYRSITPRELDDLRERLEIYQENLALLQSRTLIPQEEMPMRKESSR